MADHLTRRVPEHVAISQPAAWLLLRAVRTHLDRASASELEAHGMEYRRLVAELQGHVARWAAKLGRPEPRSDLRVSEGSEAGSPDPVEPLTVEGMSTAETATALGLSRRRVRQLAGRLDATRVGDGPTSPWRFDPEAVAAFRDEEQAS